MACKLVILEPREGQTIKAEGPFEVRADIDLEEPWFERPRWGNSIGSVSGERCRGAAFELTNERSLGAILEGTASIKDSRIDCHMEKGLARCHVAGR